MFAARDRAAENVVAVVGNVANFRSSRSAHSSLFGYLEHEPAGVLLRRGELTATG